MFDKKLKALKDTIINSETGDTYTIPEIMQELNISYATWYRYLDGKIPNGENLVRLANLFNVTPDYLVDNNIKVKPPEEVAADEIILRSRQMDADGVKNIIDRLKQSLTNRE